MLAPCSLAGWINGWVDDDGWLQGIVEVPLRAAAAADPVGYAQRPEVGPLCEEARMRRRAAYHHILATLHMLVRSVSCTRCARLHQQAGPLPLGKHIQG